MSTMYLEIIINRFNVGCSARVGLYNEDGGPNKDGETGESAENPSSNGESPVCVDSPDETLPLSNPYKWTVSFFNLPFSGKLKGVIFFRSMKFAILFAVCRVAWNTLKILRFKKSMAKL